MFKLNFILIAMHVVSIWAQISMAKEICDQIDSGDYKTVRLPDDSIQLIADDKVYTFKEGDIGNAKITDVSRIYPYDKSPIDECFVNNGDVYYIRKKKAMVYDDQTYKSTFAWSPSSGKVPSLTIKQNGETLGFFVPPISQNTGFGQSMSQSNNIQVMAYGGASSVSMTSVNGKFKLFYNGWNLPLKFNAFIDNPDGSLTFFDGDQYLVVNKNSNIKQNWKNVDQLFGC